jgi:hypothetical protein
MNPNRIKLGITLAGVLALITAALLAGVTCAQGQNYIVTAYWGGTITIDGEEMGIGPGKYIRYTGKSDTGAWIYGTLGKYPFKAPWNIVRVIQNSPNAEELTLKEEVGIEAFIAKEKIRRAADAQEPAERGGSLLDKKPEAVNFRMRSGNKKKEEFYQVARARNPGGTQAQWTAQANADFDKWAAESRAANATADAINRLRQDMNNMRNYR